MKTTNNNYFSTNVSMPMGAKLYGKCVKNLAFNQLIPDNYITKTYNVTTSPTQNICDPFVMVFDPFSPALVGHKVRVKIITDDPKFRLCWYKSYTTGFDFVTGKPFMTGSVMETATEGIYEITQSMVHEGTNHLQLYYLQCEGLSAGQHTIKIQFTDLDDMGWRDIALEQFNALYPNETYPFTARTPQTISCLEKTSVYGKNLLNDNLVFGQPSSTAFSNTTDRTFTEGTYLVGLANNNYFDKSKVEVIEVLRNKFSFIPRGGGYGIGIPKIIKPNATYSISYKFTSNGGGDFTYISFYDINGVYKRNTNVSSVKTFTTNSDEYYAVIVFRPTYNFEFTYYDIMLNEGSTVLPYESYHHQEIATPLYAIPDEDSKIVMNQLVKNGNFESTDGWSKNQCVSVANNNIMELTLSSNIGSANIGQVLSKNVKENHKYIVL